MVINKSSPFALWDGSMFNQNILSLVVERQNHSTKNHNQNNHGSNASLVIIGILFATPAHCYRNGDDAFWFWHVANQSPATHVCMTNKFLEFVIFDNMALEMTSNVMSTQSMIYTCFTNFFLNRGGERCHEGTQTQTDIC